MLIYWQSALYAPYATDLVYHLFSLADLEAASAPVIKYPIIQYIISLHFIIHHSSARTFLFPTIAYLQNHLR